MARKAKKQPKPLITAAADRAEARSAGKDVDTPDNPILSPSETKIKRPVGRPTVYRPEMCQEVIELGAQGKSRAQIARTLGVDRATIAEWEKTKPEFTRAMVVSTDYSIAWWEDQGQAGIHLGKNFNGFVYGFQMRNRFRSEYVDKVDVKLDAGDSFKNLWTALAGGAAAIPEPTDE